uniref:Uncharacterized protein n=1 Tax=Soybean cyst nematode associated northern cereal mosaic virus TaxID=1034378 RepID=G0WXQ5_9RHAB|nr:putative glycoprotein [Soybean cyst nematode associated northern cereal mosaic virus]
MSSWFFACVCFVFSLLPLFQRSSSRPIFHYGGSDSRPPPTLPPLQHALQNALAAARLIDPPLFPSFSRPTTTTPPTPAAPPSSRAPTTARPSPATSRTRKLYIVRATSPRTLPHTTPSRTTPSSTLSITTFRPTAPPQTSPSTIRTSPTLAPVTVRYSPPTSTASSTHIRHHHTTAHPTRHTHMHGHGQAQVRETHTDEFRRDGAGRPFAVVWQPSTVRSIGTRTWSTSGASSAVVVRKRASEEQKDPARPVVLRPRRNVMSLQIPSMTAENETIRLENTVWIPVNGAPTVSILEQMSMASVESELWKKVATDVRVFREHALEKEGFGCICEKTSVVDTCTNGWFTVKQEHTSRREEHPAYDECFTKCVAARANELKEKKAIVMKDPGDLDCPSKFFSNTYTLVKSEFLLSWVEIHTGEGGTTARFSRFGIPQACLIETGECTGTQERVIVFQNTLRNVACNHEAVTAQNCTLYAPRDNPVRQTAKVVCEKEEREYFPHERVKSVPACLGRSPGNFFLATTGELLESDSAQTIGEKDMAFSSGTERLDHADFLIREVARLVGRIELSIMRELRQLQGSAGNECPTKQTYLSGHYAVGRGAGVSVGTPLEKAEMCFVSPVVVNATLKVKCTHRGSTHSLYYIPESGMALPKACGARQMAYAVVINATHRAVLTGRQFMLTNKLQTTQDEIALARLSGSSLGSGSDDRGSPVLPHNDVSDKDEARTGSGVADWIAGALDWLLRTDVLIASICIAGGVTVLVLYFFCPCRPRLVQTPTGVSSIALRELLKK